MIAEIAEEEIASRFGKLAAGDVDTKSGPNDFVTKPIWRRNGNWKSTFRFLSWRGLYWGRARGGGPEACSTLETDEGAFWIVDPLDGTRNFVQGREEFGTIVALVVDGETRAGWIYAIPDKSTAMAEKGEGAAWRGERLRPLALKEGALQGGAGYRQPAGTMAVTPRPEPQESFPNIAGELLCLRIYSLCYWRVGFRPICTCTSLGSRRWHRDAPGN